MTASELILKLIKKKVELDVQENNLVIDALPGVLNKELIKEIKASKEEIINILKLDTIYDWQDVLKIHHMARLTRVPYYVLKSTFLL